MIKVIMFEISALLLFYSCFCRASFTSKKNSRRDIRWVFTFLGVMSILCIAAPLWDYKPDALTVCLMVAITLVQYVTSYHWYRGVPEPFQKETP